MCIYRKKGMQGTAALLTPHEMAYTLGIHPFTLDTLVHNGILPHTYIRTPDQRGEQLRFNPYIITKWFQSSPQLEELTNKDYLDSLQKQYETLFPDTVRSLQALNSQFAPKRAAKGYNLAKVTNKTYGFLYYVRYIRNGKLIPSRWCTHTNNLKAAEQFARDNREKILAAYDEKHVNSKTNLYHVLTAYYKKDSPYLNEIKHRGRILGEKTRSVYFNFMKKVCIPFFKENHTALFDDIKPPLIAKLQTTLLAKGNKPQTVNRYLGAVSSIFEYLVLDGTLEENVFDKVAPLKVKKSTRTRGCYDLDKIAGVFKRKWHDEVSYLLCLLIYSTGIRNSEIEKIQVKDLTGIKDCRFINIPKSKTPNGIRMVPLHGFVYDKITAYVRKTKKQSNDFIFSEHGGHNQSTVYKSANTALGKRLGFTEADLNTEYITFYSGRHYWKTLMNANNLGEVEEYFMGHRVSNDVSKRYNHRDKQGRKMVIKKAKEVFTILDRWIFKP